MNIGQHPPPGLPPPIPAPGSAVVVRPAPVARGALGIMRVLRTIRNFMVNPPRTGQYDLTQLYDLCICSLFRVVYHRREEAKTALASLDELRRYEGRLRRAEREARRAESSQHMP